MSCCSQRSLLLSPHSPCGAQLKKDLARRNDSKYTSVARSTLRMMWYAAPNAKLQLTPAILTPFAWPAPCPDCLHRFLDFVNDFVDNLSAEPPQELRPCAVRAYESSLGTHHPWILRKAVAVRSVLAISPSEPLASIRDACTAYPRRSSCASRALFAPCSQAVMVALPHRESFMIKLSGTTAEEGLVLLKRWIAYVAPLRRAMWAYFTHRGIAVID